MKTNLHKKLPQIVLLPGMDGTGELFADFAAVLRGEFEVKVVRYSTDKCQSYSELAGLIRTVVLFDEPFVLLAESFSTPLAIHYASEKPPNLRGLVLCAGFVSSPLRGWKRFAASLLASITFRFTLPSFLCRLFFVGPGAPASLVIAVCSAISSVRPSVLTARLHALLASDFCADLAQIDVPLLYIQAGKDRLIDTSCLGEILRIKPEMSSVTVPGPHLLLQREPVRTAEIVAGFARQFWTGEG